MISFLFVDSNYIIVDAVYTQKGAFMKNRFTKSLALLSAMISITACSSPQVRPLPGIESNVSELETLNTQNGVLGYEDSQSGKVTVLCVPGLGDTRGTFRMLAPLLVKSGYRVIVLDPRGQGDSDATFDGYTARKAGEDIVEFIDKLKITPIIVGNSSGAASAAWAASERPKQVRGLVFIGGFLRDHPMGFFQKLGLRLALIGPWGPSIWIQYYKSLFITQPPSDQETYTDALSRSLKQKHHMSALRQLAFASKSDVESRLREIKTPVLALAGSKDPDFSNPKEELEWIHSQLGGEIGVIEGAGHYPQLEYPKDVFLRIESFISKNRS